MENPRIVAAEEATARLPGWAGPLIRALDLPGFLLLDRAGPA